MLLRAVLASIALGAILAPSGCGSALPTYFAPCDDDLGCDPELACLPFVPPGEDEAIRVCSQACSAVDVEADPRCPAPNCGRHADCVDDGVGGGICGVVECY